MTEVVSVRFKSRGKLYFFAPNGIEIPDKSTVVVETSNGLELGECSYGNHWVTDERVIQPLRPVIRIATAGDLRIIEVNKIKEKDAFDICQKRIAVHKLEMKLVDVECNFEGNKILFFFASEGRVDFRDLVKDLASIFRTRIELRQIGVRDEAKMLGGLGICGRPFCCHQFLDEFLPVSTKMAKTQSMSLNPTKISGICGRLMCCLRYEQEAYEELVKNVPKNGAFVQTTEGYGNVTQINLLRQKIKVRVDGREQAIKVFDVHEVATVPGGRPKPGEPLPSVLKAVPKTEETETETTPVVVSEKPAFRQENRRSSQPAPRRDNPPKRDNPPRRDGAPKRDNQPRRDNVPKPAVNTAPKAEGNDVEKGEKAPAKRRPRNRKPRPQNQNPNANVGANTENKETQPKPKTPRPPQKPKGEAQPPRNNQPKPKPDGTGEAQAKKPDNRRRYYHRKPKSGNSGGSAKAE